MGKRGPKSKFSRVLGEKIIAEIHSGKNMAQVAKEFKFSYNTVLQWQKEHNWFALGVNEARIATVYPYLDAAEELLASATTRDEILKAKETLNQARWKAEKLLPAFQPVQKQEIKHEGAQVSVVTWLPPEEVANRGAKTVEPRANLGHSGDKPLKTLEHSPVGTTDAVLVNQ